jgi:hypothetical protein
MKQRNQTITSTLVCWCTLLLAGSARVLADPNPRQHDSSIGTTKPWVDDFPAFANSTGGKRWIVGRSTPACLSEDEAFQAASRDARIQLLARVRPQLPNPYNADSEAWLARRLDRDLAAGRLITDRFVSRIRRPYGELWTEAILVDASGDRFAGLARDYSTWLRTRGDTRRGAVASVVGLSLAILLVYAAVNAITKGYFRGRLRAGAAVSLALGLLVVIWSIRGMG